jgi:phosphotransferase system enzyme I (PtsI)
MTEASGERVFQGIGVSGGTAIGQIRVLRETAAVWREFTTLENETALLAAAIATARTGIEALIAGDDKLAGEILEFQLALLEDDDFLAPVHRAMSGGMPADKAWSWVLDAEIADYTCSGSEVLSARAADLTDLKLRVLSGIQGGDAAPHEVMKGAILVAADLTPSAFLSLDWHALSGAVTLGGSPTSHVSILARARGVSLIVGLGASLDDFADGAPAVLDAGAGRLTLRPKAETIAAAETAIGGARESANNVAAILNRPAVTATGETVSVLVNIDEPSLLDGISPDICDGVGLTRTEFLFKDGHQPSEDEQFAFYARLIAWARGRPVTIRTLDAGGDKPIPGVTIDGETNPFLGIRGIRLSLARPELLAIQLRALARAAALGSVKVMLPMVTVPAELTQVRQMLGTEIEALHRTGKDCAYPPLGIMIEVPAAALTAERFDADFYSVGSNDLIQYAMAAARDNAKLSTLADAANPAVIELIARTVAAGKNRGVEVSLCGDMASSPVHIAPLLDTGLRILSCAPAQVGPVKLAVSRYDGRSAPGHG